MMTVRLTPYRMGVSAGKSRTETQKRLLPLALKFSKGRIGAVMVSGCENSALPDLVKMPSPSSYNSSSMLLPFPRVSISTASLISEGMVSSLH
jgi:hypothetical protein